MDLRVILQVNKATCEELLFNNNPQGSGDTQRNVIKSLVWKGKKRSIPYHTQVQAMNWTSRDQTSVRKII